MPRIALLLSLVVLAFTADTAVDMAKAMEMMKPGPEHQKLVAFAGDWTVSSKFWMDPSQPAMESTGTATFSTIFDGRYLKQEYSGDMMGDKFTGIGFEGYDNTTKKYQTFWIDSMSTMMFKLDGSSSDGGKTIEYKGEMPCPMVEGLVKARWVHKHVSNDQFTMDMYMTPKDKELKTGELVYTRKK
jgi:hypothetical protein